MQKGMLDAGWLILNVQFHPIADYEHRESSIKNHSNFCVFICHFAF